MKKKMLHRALLGAPMGLAISYLITIAISLGWGGGAYNPCMPELIALTGSESGAVALQAAVACLVGAGFAGSSVVWEIEHWGLARQTGVYFLLLALFMLRPPTSCTGWSTAWPALRGISGRLPSSLFSFGQRSSWPAGTASAGSTPGLPSCVRTGSRRKPAGQSRRHCRWEAGRAAIEMEQPRRSV